MSAVALVGVLRHDCLGTGAGAGAGAGVGAGAGAVAGAQVFIHLDCGRGP